MSSIPIQYLTIVIHFNQAVHPWGILMKLQLSVSETIAVPWLSCPQTHSLPLFWNCQFSVSRTWLNQLIPPWTNGRHFADDNFKCISWIKSFVFRLKITWCLFPRGHLTICQHWFGAKPLPEPMLTQCSDAYMRHYHGWPSTQPGSLHTALQRKYTQPCSLFSRGTAVWTMGARLCQQWGKAVCKCPAV